LLYLKKIGLENIELLGYSWFYSTVILVYVGSMVKEEALGEVSLLVL
jgi:hypothetical protein